jgi:hypothetical protein
VASPQPPLPSLSTQADLEKAAQIITSNFERMQSYSKVIIGLGYGALLAIWSGTKQVLPERLLVTSGLLIVLSMLAYILFEVGQMIVYSWMSFRWSHSVNTKGLPMALADARKREEKVHAPLVRVWLITLVIAVLTGFGAAGILIYSFCRRLLLS